MKARKRQGVARHGRDWRERKNVREGQAGFILDLVRRSRKLKERKGAKCRASFSSISLSLQVPRFSRVHVCTSLCSITRVRTAVSFRKEDHQLGSRKKSQSDVEATRLPRRRRLQTHQTERVEKKRKSLRKLLDFQEAKARDDG